MQALCIRLTPCMRSCAADDQSQSDTRTRDEGPRVRGSRIDRQQLSGVGGWIPGSRVEGLRLESRL
eukprot:3794360-Rhodomonas_salina.1